MEYTIKTCDAFEVIGYSETMPSSQTRQRCPKMWDEFYQNGLNQFIMGQYGICFDDGEDQSRYMIGDDDKGQLLPATFTKETIPANTWAVFESVGPLPEMLQVTISQTFQTLFTDHITISSGCVIEAYDDPSLYLKGTQDVNYHCSFMIPIKVAK